MMRERLSDEQIAKLFHDTYEQLAADFGYETRPDTRVFDAKSQNGRLMIATVSAVIPELSPASGGAEPVAIGESRWLIERTYAKGHPAERREFWLGITDEGVTEDSFSGNTKIWTTNPIEAARFSSKAITENLRYRHFHPEAPVEVCEHMFNCGIAPAAHPAPAQELSDLADEVMKHQWSNTGPAMTALHNLMQALPRSSKPAPAQGMPDEQIRAIADKWARSNFRIGVLEIESAIKEAVRALGGA